MSDLRSILKEEYTRKEKMITPTTLMEMIEEVMGLPLSLLKEENGSTSSSATVDWTAIPEVPISELGWAALHSNEEGAPHEARQQLQQFLEQIQGDDLRAKLKYIDDVYKNPEKVMKRKSMAVRTPGEKIAATLSFLVFIKTLTTIITNFNAASAGFNFEAFLGVLLGGGQISTGSKTIADLQDEKGRPISLKLYQEKTLKAGGSYTDLVNDLIRKPFYSMQYVVATKTLTGEGLDAEGIVDVYRYELDIDNILQILYNSALPHNSENIQLPSSVIAGETGLGFKIPKVPSPEQIATNFAQRAYAGLERARLGDLWPPLDDALDYSTNAALFKGKDAAASSFLTQNRPGSVKDILNQFAKQEDALISDEQAVLIFNILNDANEKAVAQVKKAKERIASFTKGEKEWASPEDSLAFYNGLSLDQKRRALMSSRGYRFTKQYELTRRDIYNIQALAARAGDKEGSSRVFGGRGTRGQTDVHIGQIVVGKTKLQETLNKMVNEVNESVFIIFQNLKTLTTNLQAYFAGALTDDTQAATAIGASHEIEGRTQELRPDTKK
tara:strand:+ start:217 stop:1884 length:1668 start_codon:yes stop_codon:yes gene_type:complete